MRRGDYINVVEVVGGLFLGVPTKFRDNPLRTQSCGSHDIFVLGPEQAQNKKITAVKLLMHSLLEAYYLSSVYLVQTRV